MEQPSQPGLIRGIRRWDLVAVAINGIIGAGIFGLPSRVFGLIGGYSIAAFVICAIVVALIVLCFAEVGSRFTQTGGPYLYAREAFGPAVGFQVGWLMWLARLTAFAANCNLLVAYSSYFWPGVGSGLGRAGLIAAVVGVLAAVNIAGVRDAARVSNIFTVGKLIPIILFIVVGLAFVDPANISFEGAPGYGAFSTSVLLLIYAFTGFEMAVIPAGEVNDPRRNLPLALLLAIGAVAIIYILIQIICIGTLAGLAESERPLADAASLFLGPAGGLIISIGALISIFGNLNVILLAGSRLPYAMAARHELPEFLAATHRRFHTPHSSIALTAVVVLALTVSGSFIYAVTVSAIARLLAYAATCAALPTLRLKAGAPAGLFRAPAGILIAVLSLLLAAWLLSNSTWREARDAGIAVAIGLAVYITYRAIRRITRSKDALDAEAL